MPHTTYANYLAETTYFVYDGDQVIAELDGDGWRGHIQDYYRPVIFPTVNSTKFP